MCKPMCKPDATRQPPIPWVCRGNRRHVMRERMSIEQRYASRELTHSVCRAEPFEDVPFDTLAEIIETGRLTSFPETLGACCSGLTRG